MHDKIDLEPYMPYPAISEGSEVTSDCEMLDPISATYELCQPVSDYNAGGIPTSVSSRLSVSTSQLQAKKLAVMMPKAEALRKGMEVTTIENEKELLGSPMSKSCTAHPSSVTPEQSGSLHSLDLENASASTSIESSIDLHLHSLQQQQSNVPSEQASPPLPVTSSTAQTSQEDESSSYQDTVFQRKGKFKDLWLIHNT